MAILAPDNGQRVTLTPDPVRDATAFRGALGAGFMSQAGAIGLRAFLALQNSAAAKKAREATEAAARAAAAASRRISVPQVLPRSVPPPSFTRPSPLPPLVPLPGPPGRPGATPGRSPVSAAPVAAGGGFMVLLVAVALLASFRR